MPLCFECISEAETSGDEPKMWHYETVDEPCSRCDAGLSHERRWER